MSTKDSLAAAREHASAIGDHARKALAAHVDGDGSATRRHLREVAAAHAKLRDAHDAIARSIRDEPDGHDPAVNPSAAMGAQTSAGQSPRDYSPEAIRQRDQRASIEAAYKRRVALEGLRR